MNSIMKRVIPEVVSGYELTKEEFGEFFVVLPEESINYVSTPKADGGLTTNYNGDACTLEISSLQSLFGVFSFRGYNDVPTKNAGISYTTLVTDDVLGQIYTFSVYVKVKAGSTVKLEVNSDDPMGDSPPISRKFKASGLWQRLSLTFSGRNLGWDFRLFVVVVDAVTELYTDAWQLEKKPYATTYFDGSFSDESVVSPSNLYWWDVVPYGSVSHRSQFALNGGKEIRLADLGFRFMGVTGLGLATPTNVFDTLNNGIGFYNKRTYSLRDFSLVGAVFGTSFKDLQKNVNDIENLFDQFGRIYEGPIRLIYRNYDQHGNVIVEQWIECYYVNGLEGNIDNLYQQRLAIQLRSSDPALYDLAYTSHNMIVETAISDPSPIIVLSPDGSVKSREFITWNPVTEYVWAFATVPDNFPQYPGQILVGGNFGTAPFTLFVKVTDGSGWGYIPVGLDDPFTGDPPTYGSGKIGVRCFVVDKANSVIFVGGRFSGGGLTGDSIFYFDSNWNVHDLGSGCTDATYNNRLVTDMILYHGLLIAIGRFNEMGGVPNTNYIAAWSAGAWVSIGNLGSDPGENAKINLYGDDILITGNFTSAGGVANTLRIALWNSNTGWASFTTATIGAEITASYVNYPYVYIAGLFHGFTAIHTGFTTGHAAFWDGTKWIGMVLSTHWYPSYIQYSKVRKIIGGPSNSVIFVGDTWVVFNISHLSDPLPFPAASNQIGRIDFSSFPVKMSHLLTPGTFPVDFGVFTSIWAAMYLQNGTLLLGGMFCLDQKSIMAEVVNESDDVVYPTFVIRGPGTLLSVNNYTTGKVLSFTNLILADLESLVVTFTPYGFSLSSNRIDINSHILSNTDVSMEIVKGKNLIYCNFTGTTGPNTYGYVKYRNRYLKMRH